VLIVNLFLNLKSGGCEPLTSFSLPGAFFYSVAFARGMFRLYAAPEGVYCNDAKLLASNTTRRCGDFKINRNDLSFAQEKKHLPSRNKVGKHSSKEMHLYMATGRKRKKRQ